MKIRGPRLLFEVKRGARSILVCKKTGYRVFFQAKIDKTRTWYFVNFGPPPLMVGGKSNDVLTVGARNPTVKNDWSAKLYLILPLPLPLLPPLPAIYGEEGSNLF